MLRALDPPEVVEGPSAAEVPGGDLDRKPRRLQHFDSGPAHLGLEIRGERVGPEEDPAAVSGRRRPAPEPGPEVAGREARDFALGGDARDGPGDPREPRCS